jgi:hypothetical protein
LVIVMLIDLPAAGFNSRLPYRKLTHSGRRVFPAAGISEQISREFR